MNLRDGLIQKFAEWDPTRHSRDDHGRFDGNGGGTDAGRDTKGRLRPPSHQDAHPGRPIATHPPSAPKVPGAISRIAAQQEPRKKESILDTVRDMVKHGPFGLHGRLVRAFAWDPEAHPRDERGRFDPAEGSDSSAKATEVRKEAAYGSPEYVKKGVERAREVKEGKRKPPLEKARERRDKESAAQAPRRTLDPEKSKASKDRLMERIRQRHEERKNDPAVPAQVTQLLLAAGNAESLISWFNDGAAGQIPWGEHGAFDACVNIASKHMDDDQAKGFCAEREHDATGHWPGEKKT